MARRDTERRDDAEASETAAGDDEGIGAQVAPIVTTEEDGEDVLPHITTPHPSTTSGLHRFDGEGNQWKERGAGTVKLLKHKETGKVRLVMRQAKTLKICTNHLGRNKEDCKHFMEMVEEVAQLLGKKQESEDATTAAELVEKLSVAESETKENEPGEEVPVALSDKKSPEIVHVKTESEKRDEPSSAS